jgi:hypothetical protein
VIDLALLDTLLDWLGVDTFLEKEPVSSICLCTNTNYMQSKSC